MMLRPSLSALSIVNYIMSHVRLTYLPNRVAQLTLCAPPINAMTVKMGTDFGAVLSTLDTAKASAVVLHGEGSSFSAGGDISFLRQRATTSPSENVQTMLDFYSLYLEPLRFCPVPVIASVHGNAVGAGACLATACDMRVVSSDAKVGFTFTSGVAIHPGMGSTHFLSKIIGQEHAARLLLTGELLSGRTMVSMGWGMEAVDVPEDVLKRAIKLAERVAAAAPTASRLTLETLRAAGNVGLREALEREAQAQAECYAGSDFLVGVEAVVAKAKPAWTQYS